MNTDAAQMTHPVRLGADRIVTDRIDLIAGRRVGVLTNHTGRCSDGTAIVDAVIESGAARVVALFGPEHGIFGTTPDGTAVDHSRHPRYGIPVYSLYGRTHKPTPEMLSDVEVLVCDIQDIGARFYTYSTTVALTLEAASEQDIPFVLLDRPNPIRGLGIEGPVRKSALKSFVGWFPLPIVHGMTLGELLSMVEREGWLNTRKRSLEVVTLEHWKRAMWFDETGLPWNAPSPNMPSLETAVVYPGTCLLEGTSVSEGRGTDRPFELIGAPWADPEAILKRLENYSIPGAQFAGAEFTPRHIPGVSANPKYLGQHCRGVRISVANRERVEPVRLGIALLSAFKGVHPGETELRNRRFDILSGDADVRRMLEKGANPEDIVSRWKGELEAFEKIRSRYLLYD